MPGSRLSALERHTVARALQRGESFAAIARRLGRSTSTVSRYVARQESAGLLPAKTSPLDDTGTTALAHGLATVFRDSGVPRAPSRVLAELLLAPVGRTAAELMSELQVSAASISRAIGYLDQLALIRRESSDRRDRYLIRDDAWAQILHLNAQRNTRWADLTRRALASGSLPLSVHQRFSRLQALLTALGADMDAVGGATAEGERSDVGVLLAALVHAGRPLDRAQMAHALGWSSARLRSAVSWAGRNPAALAPLTLVVSAEGLSAGVAPDVLSERTRDLLARALPRR